MKKVLVFAALCAFFTACQNQNAASGQPEAAKKDVPAPTAAAQKTIVFFGNSLTAAYQLSREQGFVALVQQKIDAEKLPFSTVNAGLSGETTADGKNRVDWILKNPVDIFEWGNPATYANLMDWMAMKLVVVATRSTNSTAD